MLKIKAKKYLVIKARWIYKKVKEG